MIKLILILGLLLPTALAAQRPNIVYIMTDDMGYADLSCYGRKDYTTPNIDKLSTQGVKFMNAYSAGSLCTPTRVAFYTGRYPARTAVGLMEPLTPTKRDSAYGLTPDIPSLGTMLKTAGYHTGLVGKWHLGFRPEHSPMNNGFDYFFGIRSGAADYVSHKGDGGQHDLHENDSLVYPEGYLTDLISGKAIDFLKQKRDQPFFLAVMYNAPHWPWQKPGDKAYPDSVNFTQGGSPEIYAGIMKSLDDGVGKILMALDEAGLTQNTVVIFTNDNGGERFSDHGGLAKSKRSLWEGGIKVPAFVRWPQKIKGGRVSEQVVVTMDWTATILSLSGAKPSKHFPLDGVDLVPMLTGTSRADVDRTLFWRTFQRDRQKAIRSGDWKYLEDDGGSYLFNLKNDPGEKNNLIDSQRKIAADLKARYTAWEKTVLTPIPLR
jgi:arylsulfatase A-like enzyme